MCSLNFPVTISKLGGDAPVTIVLLFAALLSLATVAHATMAPQGIRTAAMEQTPKGISLFEQGQNEEAIKVLRDLAKRYDDLRAWHYLGLALEKKGKPNDARKAHEKAAKLGDKFLESQLSRVQRDEDMIRLLLPWKTELSEAAESAKKYLTLSVKPSRSKTEEWTARSESLLGFADIANEKAPTLFKSKDVDVKVRILTKPEAVYTEEARQRKISGLIVLKVIFAGTGRVMGVRIVKGLPAGLTGEAIKAAHGIKFIPALKDGKPVSVFAQVEYTFNIY